MNTDLFAFIFGAIGCSVTVGTILWRVLLLKLNSEVLLLRHDLERKDFQIASLQDVQTLSHNGLQEKFGHYSSRARTEIAEIAKHVRQIEHFLAKTSEYEPRE